MNLLVILDERLSYSVIICFSLQQTSYIDSLFISYEFPEVKDLIDG